MKGVKHDTGKPDMTLVPTLAIEQMVRVMEFGAQKYGRDNWRHVQGAERRYLAASLRHIFAHLRGELRDAESGEPHLAHALTCLAFVLELDAVSKQD